jgi:hypothetical protein
MYIDVLSHGGFFGRVFTLRGIIARFDGAAMVGEYGGFGAGESVGWAFDEFGAKDLGSASEQLFTVSLLLQTRAISITHPDFDKFPKCYLESPLAAA